MFVLVETLESWKIAELYFHSTCKNDVVVGICV